MAIPVFDDKNNLVYLDLENIYSIYKEPDPSRKIVIQAIEGTFYFPWTLKHIDLIMTDYGFAKVDKNKIVNLKQVKNYVVIDKVGNVTVDGNTYEVSRRRKKEFEKKLRLYRSRPTNG